MSTPLQSLVATQVMVYRTPAGQDVTALYLDNAGRALLAKAVERERLEREVSREIAQWHGTPAVEAAMRALLERLT